MKTIDKMSHEEFNKKMSKLFSSVNEHIKYEITESFPNDQDHIYVLKMLHTALIARIIIGFSLIFNSSEEDLIKHFNELLLITMKDLKEQNFMMQ